MFVEIPLQDPTLCEDCPHDDPSRVQCGRGYYRQFMKIMRQFEKEEPIGPRMLGMMGTRIGIEAALMRPAECILENEAKATRLAGSLVTLSKNTKERITDDKGNQRSAAAPQVGEDPFGREEGQPEKREGISGCDGPF